eukprot:g8935.t1
MAPVIMHKKNTTALRRLGLYWLKNFGQNICGDLSVLTTCLVDKGGYHPLQAQQVLYAQENRGRVKKLVACGRERIATLMLARPRDEFHTDGPVVGEELNLPNMEAWAQEIIRGGQLDVRGIYLVAEQYQVSVQVLQQMVEGDTFMLRDVDGLCTPLRDSGHILWTSGCHFEAVVLEGQGGRTGSADEMLSYLEATFISTDLTSTPPVPAQVPASHGGDTESSSVLFGDFPGMSVAPAGGADGGDDTPFSAPPAAATASAVVAAFVSFGDFPGVSLAQEDISPSPAAPASPASHPAVFADSIKVKVRLTKNQKRAAARKKAYQARVAKGDGQETEAPEAPEAPEASPTPKIFRRGSGNRSRRRLGEFGDFPGMPVAPAGGADGGDDTPFSAPPAAATASAVAAVFVSFGDFPGVSLAQEDISPSPAAPASPASHPAVFADSIKVKVRLTKNQKRAAARKKAYQARVAKGDGQETEAPEAPEAPERRRESREAGRSGAWLEEAARATRLKKNAEGDVNGASCHGNQPEVATEGKRD